MNTPDLVLFDMVLLANLLEYWRISCMNYDWRPPAKWRNGYVDDEPRNAAWVKHVFGNN